MRLHLAARLPEPDAVTADLCEAARAFFAGGGRLSLGEWAEQSPIEREALRLAFAGEEGPGAVTIAPSPVSAEELRERDERARHRRELLAALQGRGHDLADEADLDATLQRLGLYGLIRSLVTGWALEQAVERFEAAWEAHQAQPV